MTLGAFDIAQYSRNKNVIFESPFKKRRLQRALARLSLRMYHILTAGTSPVYSDRIIEYPILFQHLDPTHRTILDFGCVEDLLPIHLASLGYKVTGLDFRSYPLTHPNFQFIQGDILKWEPPPIKFDCAISISTVEHVGLGGYGDPQQNQGDKLAVSKLLSAVRPGGSLILTVPCGQPTVQRNLRVYDEELIRKTVPNIEILRFFCKRRRHDPWTEADAGEIKTLVYDDYYQLSPTQGVAFILARQM